MFGSITSLNYFLIQSTCPLLILPSLPFIKHFLFSVRHSLRRERRIFNSYRFRFDTQIIHVQFVLRFARMNLDPHESEPLCFLSFDQAPGRAEFDPNSSATGDNKDVILMLVFPAKLCSIYTIIIAQHFVCRYLVCFA